MSCHERSSTLVHRRGCGNPASRRGPPTFARQRVVARIELCWESSEDERRLIVAAAAEALVEALRVPHGDPTVIAVHRPVQDVVRPSKVGDRYTIVTVTMFSGRTGATKQTLYAAMVERLERCGVPASDVLIILNEVPPQNWGVDGGIPASEADIGFKIDI